MTEQYPDILGYEVIRLLGKGGFGEVYLCKKDGQEYAIKRIMGMLGNTEFDDFIREIRNLYIVSLVPHTVKYIDSFTIVQGVVIRIFAPILRGEDVYKSTEYNSIPEELQDVETADNYIVTSYARGGNIEDYYLPRDNAINIVREIIETVLSYHSCGFVHKDIKGQNVLYDENAQDFTIIDFGAGNILKESHQDKGKTSEYIAPEEVETFIPQYSRTSFIKMKYEDYDYRKRDSYSTGVMLFKIFNKVSPFTGDSKTYESKLNPIKSNSGNSTLDTMIDLLIMPSQEDRINLEQALELLG